MIYNYNNTIYLYGSASSPRLRNSGRSGGVIKIALWLVNTMVSTASSACHEHVLELNNDTELQEPCICKKK